MDPRELQLVENFKKCCCDLWGLFQFKDAPGKIMQFIQRLHCIVQSTFSPCTSDTVSKSFHCQCKNPKWDFACPVGNKPQRGEILPKPSGKKIAHTLHVAGDGPVPWRCGSSVKSAGGSCLGALPSTSRLGGRSGLKPRGSASKAAVSAGVGG